jgi:hypothetical protein
MWCRTAGLILFVAGLAAALPAVAAVTPIMIDAAPMQKEAGGAVLQGRYRATVDIAQLLATQPGESIGLTVPGHAAFEIVFDRIARTAAAQTWIGHLKGYVDEQRSIITVANGTAVGEIATPEGRFHLGTTGGITTLTDLDRAGVRFSPLKDPTLLPPRRSPLAAADDKAASPPRQKTSAGNSQIDVLVFYDSTFEVTTGSGSQATATIENLIQTANQAMSDSGVGVNFNLVGTQYLDMSSSDTNTMILDKMTYPSDQEFIAQNPGYTADSQLVSDPVYARVSALRDQFGADLVVAIRQFALSQQSCGVGWQNYELGNQSDQTGILFASVYGYSVVSYGQVNNGDGSYYVCAQVTMAHEMGHNMGSAHDRPDAVGYGSPAFSYSYGYGLSTSAATAAGNGSGFATIMAANYIQAPIIAKYSSPGYTCGGYVCGIVDTDPNNAADNVTSLNNTRALVAQFRASKAGNIPVVPAAGYWYNPAAAGTGFTIEQNATSGNVFVAAYLYAANGNPVWYAAGPAQLSGNMFNAPMIAFSGGETLSGNYQPASVGPSPGNMSITFTDASDGTLTWPGGAVPVTRFSFATNGLNSPPNSTQPQTGYWYNPAEPGRGYTIEVQNNTLFLAAYMYDGSGNPVWYASGPSTLVGNNTFEGTLTEFSGGQSLTGSYKPPTGTAAVGVVTIQFQTSTTGILTLPDGKQIPIQRFSF